MNSIGSRDAERSAARATTSVPTDHEGGVEHVDGGDDARAAVGAGPGLHRREGRHDEQAAGDREAGEIDRDADAASRMTNTCADAVAARRASGAP